MKCGHVSFDQDFFVVYLDGLFCPLGKNRSKNVGKQCPCCCLVVVAVNGIYAVSLCSSFEISKKG